MSTCQNYTANHRNCNTYATLGDYFNNDAGKNITCPYLYRPELHCAGSGHQPGSLPQNGSVAWCFLLNEFIVGTVSICIDSTGHYRPDPNNEMAVPALRDYANKATVLDDGRLSFPEVKSFLQDAKINCTVFDEDGHVCGEDAFNFTLFTRSKQN